LCIVCGPGSFGRQVADGAEAIACRLGIRTVRAAPDDQIPPPSISAGWDLFSAGAFEQDAELAGQALRLSAPPRHVCAVAAGVREFRHMVENPEGVFGIAQWFPGSGQEAALGPSEAEFITAYVNFAAQAGIPPHPRGEERAGAVPGHPAVPDPAVASDPAVWRGYPGLPDYPAVQAAAGAMIAVHCARIAGAASRERLWATATGLETSTLFGGFGIDQETGAQIRHQAVLVRWASGEPVPVRPH
jgi:hypothetical protein